MIAPPHLKSGPRAAIKEKELAYGNVWVKYGNSPFDDRISGAINGFFLLAFDAAVWECYVTMVIRNEA